MPTAPARRPIVARLGRSRRAPLPHHTAGWFCPVLADIRDQGPARSTVEWKETLPHMQPSEPIAERLRHHASKVNLGWGVPRSHSADTHPLTPKLTMRGRTKITVSLSPSVHVSGWTRWRRGHGLGCATPGDGGDGLRVAFGIRDSLWAVSWTARCARLTDFRAAMAFDGRYRRYQRRYAQPTMTWRCHARQVRGVHRQGG